MPTCWALQGDAGLRRVTGSLLCCWLLQGGSVPAALLQAILESCRGALNRTVDLLLEKEVLTGEQLIEIMNLHPPVPEQRPPPDSEVRLHAKLHPMACAVPSLSMHQAYPTRCATSGSFSSAFQATYSH